ncbi:3-hydroxy-3-methylglutaryl-coenzyme A reductase [Marinilabilia salmonicolor]|jgi:hydroxymethylglutaryl-CoA reductase|uniref:hydroxymethylglutaryl-CoA reductase n=1 Tax=Marinilabilia salmonicolor TaxID=989 RepID=UPI000D050E3E|nr:hydroxymethylglutaryl-CoA reductase [Marinilabilia salmonicolor]PRZ00243.1 3-hydroxy-3-methylglutaryl-coenzyme A reductase [Marinilabilia salmonicolor]
MDQIIKGFSKLSREEKIEILRRHFQLPEDFAEILKTFRHPDRQELFDDFSENTLSNFYLPFGVAPNFKIDDNMYVVPMVVEESSVVAAASRAASFWAKNGGFKTTIHNTLKKGHIWFKWDGPKSFFANMPEGLEEKLREAVVPLTANMEKRGGGVRAMEIIPLEGEYGLFQLHISFETVNSMGANFINSCLEEMKEPLKEFFNINKDFKQYGETEIIMAILSNYTTECLVTSTVECPIEALSPFSAGMEPAGFAQKFKRAVDIALSDTSRAVTHNKGIFNGTDAVVIATGNDFRAAEAAGHAWAAKDGKYRSLSSCEITEKGTFKMDLTLPLALGTVGGLTRLHPMAALALEMLGNPSADELMGIAAAAGLANNFSAVASLVTTGIQKGHMKLHLSNLLKSLNATEEEQKAAMDHFKNETVSALKVKEFLKR